MHFQMSISQSVFQCSSERFLLYSGAPSASFTGWDEEPFTSPFTQQVSLQWEMLTETEDENQIHLNPLLQDEILQVYCAVDECKINTHLHTL